MTPIDDDMLMAYADGELSRDDAARVEAAIDEDPTLLRKIERFRNMKRILKKAYDSVLDEPVPQHLQALLGDVASSERDAAAPVDLSAAREARAQPSPRFAPPVWAAIAASLVVGVLAGRMLAPAEAGLFATRDGQLVARAELAQVLDTRLASDDANAAAPTRIGFSFRARDGRYCRTFTHVEGDNGVSGLACANDGVWRVRAAASETQSGGAYRQAASAAPEVLAAVDALIDGDPLEATQERAARDHHWRN